MSVSHSASPDDQTCVVWNLETGQVSTTFRLTSSGMAVCWNPLESTQVDTKGTAPFFFFFFYLLMLLWVFPQPLPGGQRSSRKIDIINLNLLSYHGNTTYRNKECCQMCQSP